MNFTKTCESTVTEMIRQTPELQMSAFWPWRQRKHLSEVSCLDMLISRLSPTRSAPADVCFVTVTSPSFPRWVPGASWAVTVLGCDKTRISFLCSFNVSLEKPRRSSFPCRSPLGSRNLQGKWRLSSFSGTNWVWKSLPLNMSVKQFFNLNFFLVTKLTKITCLVKWSKIVYFYLIFLFHIKQVQKQNNKIFKVFLWQWMGNREKKTDYFWSFYSINKKQIFYCLKTINNRKIKTNNKPNVDSLVFFVFFPSFPYFLYLDFFAEKPNIVIKKI